jgi:hypothetical protein
MMTMLTAEGERSEGRKEEGSELSKGKEWKKRGKY